MVTGSGGRAVTAWQEPDGSGVTLYSEGDPLYRAMLDDIAGARERVWMESYIFEDDAVGRPFVEEFADGAARGVDVRVRIDAIGSRYGSMLVDDEWITIGTANFDYRSFFINYELNLVARRSPRGAI
jgi:phosphatidylserine/phosphatidylglycerophosphate/cardiolipin synthase-like enzyme